jgi:hypothetical protein
MSKAVAGTLVGKFLSIQILSKRRQKMRNEFKILVHRSEESAHFKLIGEFDDKAATELIDSLSRHSRGASKIFIHTESMDGVSEYNEPHFRNSLLSGSNTLSVKILSTGRYSNLFASLTGGQIDSSNNGTH